ncbi:FAD:protein FMN transferase ApbE [Klebsiella variicola subsp. variicola]|nr:FAD:protein FMN transferase ApbE [Klebsiella variicola subsp. variicola]
MDMTFFRAALLGACVLLSGCDSAITPATPASTATVLDGKTMGTFWRVSVIGVDEAKAEALRAKVQAQLDADDRLLSTWKNDSALMRFNHAADTRPWPVSEAMADIVTLSLRIGAKTHGAMDITVGPLVNLWGFGPDKQPVTTPDAQAIAAAKARHRPAASAGYQSERQAIPAKRYPRSVCRSLHGGGGLCCRSPRAIDGAGGISRYLVSVGGALVSRGMNGEGKPWRVAIQKPTDRENAVQAIVDINGHGISTSGSYRNYYELDGKRISHVIDPQTGQPITHKLVSVTVIAPTALEADGWDTGLMVLGPEKAQQVVREQGLAVYMIVKEGEGFKTWMSPQFRTFLVGEKN